MQSLLGFDLDILSYDLSLTFPNDQDDIFIFVCEVSAPHDIQPTGLKLENLKPREEKLSPAD